MIQRIQTIYLAIAVILTSALFYTKLVTLSTKDTLYTMYYNGVFTGEAGGGELVMSMLAFTILLYVSILTGVITIFMYKKRLLQIRIAALNIGLQIGLTALIYFFAKTAGRELDAVYSFHYPMVFPLISVVLLIMAIKAIGKDEALIRSMDRIR
jgi:hypothetical protein